MLIEYYFISRIYTKFDKNKMNNSPLYCRFNNYNMNKIILISGDYHIMNIIKFFKKLYNNLDYYIIKENINENFEKDMDKIYYNVPKDSKKQNKIREDLKKKYPNVQYLYIKDMYHNNILINNKNKFKEIIEEFTE